VSGGLPQLYGILFRIVQASEPAIWIGIRIDFDRNPGATKLRNYGVQIYHTEVAD
jgi:hypothetical protein